MTWPFCQLRKCRDGVWARVAGASLCMVFREHHGLVQAQRQGGVDRAQGGHRRDRGGLEHAAHRLLGALCMLH